MIFFQLNIECRECWQKIIKSEKEYNFNITIFHFFLHSQHVSDAYLLGNESHRIGYEEHSFASDSKTASVNVLTRSDLRVKVLIIVSITVAGDKAIAS